MLHLKANSSFIQKTHDATLNILSHAEGTSIVSNKENQIKSKTSRTLYKTWIEKLPLKVLEHLLEFEEMLKDNEEVLNALVN